MVRLLLVVYVIWNEKEALKHLTASASVSEGRSDPEPTVITLTPVCNGV